MHGVKRPIGVALALNSRRIAVIKAFAQALDAQLILGINLEADLQRIAAAESQALLTGVGRQHVRALELGNEPELYTWAWFIQADGQRVPGRGRGYDFGSYVRDFRWMADSMPQWPLAGPASGSDTWLGSLPTWLRAEPRIGMVTAHRYPTSECFLSPMSPTYPTAARLLSRRSSRGLATSLAPFVAVAHARHLPLRVDEMNTVACGTAKGVSETFVTALWALDALFADLAAHIDGVNIHTYPGAPSQLFTFTRRHGRWEGRVEPEYYGLLMFARAAPAGARVLRVSGARDPIRAWATETVNGPTRVLLINVDTARAHTVDVVVTGRRRAGVLERLLAPTASATRGVTLSGQTFGAQTTTGVAAGPVRATSVIPIAHGYHMRIPSASAALLTVP
ncbi:MAG: hypothetical protein JO262_19385 [Solirubrobacterales bacterium]|nr:hypothetical protein [Solirubrobacterales bacterium]